jgi:UDP-N-acetylmuramate dehydrogenase
MIYNTFALPATADRYLAVSDKQELLEIIKNGTLVKAPFFILGGGSNIVFTSHYHGTILHPENKGIHLVEKDPATGDLLVEAAAGENWDGFVQHCIAQGWHGTENLAAIPGTVGAAPVQNVGAYGIEAKDIVHTVLTIDLATGQERIFTNEECCFGYRNSIFKETLKGKYLVWSVTFCLHSTFTPDLHYKALSDALTAEGIDTPTARQLADTIAKVRWSKLPRPEETGSAGSFFKNPIVTTQHYERLKADYPDIVAYPTVDGYKLAAGWLIEHAGWKGRSMGRCGVYEKQALVLVNRGGCTGSEVVTLANAITEDIKNQFGVTLEKEAIII